MTQLLGQLSRFGAMGMQSFRFAMESIRAQKLRSFLTLLGIVAGVATVIAMVSLVAGFNRKIMTAFQSFGATQVSIQKYNYDGETKPDQFKPRRNLEIADAEAILRLAPMAAAVSPERYLQADLRYNVTVKGPKGKEISAPRLHGGTPGYAPVNNYTIGDGRFLGDADVRHASRVCVLGASTAKTLFAPADPLLKDIFIQGVPFKIVGVMEAKGKMFGNDPDNVVVLPITTFDEMWPFVKNGAMETLYINVTPLVPTGSEDLREQCIAVLRGRRGLRTKEPDDFYVYTAESELKSLQEIIDGVASVMILIASIALVVAGVGVMNIMLVSVTERTREIGVRKAMGATKKNIATQFLVEAVALTGVGGAIGILVGLGVAMLVNLALDFPAAAPLWSIVLGFGVSTTVGLIFGMWPAMSAARKNPIEALRYE